MADTSIEPIIRHLPPWDHFQISTLGSDGDIYYLPGYVLAEEGKKINAGICLLMFITIDSCPLYNKCSTH
jgi:hypothetical protein